jgi:hypothetical protein
MPVALRTMLPSTAEVGDTVHFAFRHSPFWGKTISGFDVTINGRKIAKPEVVVTRPKAGGGAANFVFRANEPGTYQFEITPIVEGKKGEPRLDTLEVTQ